MRRGRQGDNIKNRNTENLAEKLGVAAQRVYRALAESSSVLKNYIVPGYETLHTQSKDYIMDDILDVLKEAEVVI